MILDFIVVTLSVVLLTMLTARKQEIFDNLSRNSLICGILLTVVKLMLLTGKLENIDIAQFNTTALTVMVIIRLRPILIGAFYKVVFVLMKNIFIKTNPQIQTDNHEKSEYKNNFSKLSRREIEVARLAAKGYTNAQIAETLFISSETVKRHMASIFEKLEITSRKELMNRCQGE